MFVFFETHSGTQWFLRVTHLNLLLLRVEELDPKPDPTHLRVGSGRVINGSDVFCRSLSIVAF